MNSGINIELCIYVSSAFTDISSNIIMHCSPLPTASLSFLLDTCSISEVAAVANIY